MKKCLLFSLLILATACTPSKNDVEKTSDVLSVLNLEKSEQMILLGEAHADEKCLKKEFDLWYRCYHKHRMKHLFVEVGYATAQLLNLWMKSNSDEILEQLEKD